MFTQINLVAVLLAGIAALVVGFVYYLPPLFGTIWATHVKRYSGLSDADLTPANPTAMLRTMGLWLLTYLANALVLAVLIRATNTASIQEAIVLALITGIGFGLTISSWPVIHARQPAGWWVINAGSYLLAQVVIAVVLTVVK